MISRGPFIDSAAAAAFIADERRPSAQVNYGRRRQASFGEARRAAAAAAAAEFDLRAAESGKRARKSRSRRRR